MVEVKGVRILVLTGAFIGSNLLLSLFLLLINRLRVIRQYLLTRSVGYDPPFGRRPVPFLPEGYVLKFTDLADESEELCSFPFSNHRLETYRILIHIGKVLLTGEILMSTRSKTFLKSFYFLNGVQEPPSFR